MANPRKNVERQGQDCKRTGGNRKEMCVLCCQLFQSIIGAARLKQRGTGRDKREESRERRGSARERASEKEGCVAQLCTGYSNRLKNTNTNSDTCGSVVLKLIHRTTQTKKSKQQKAKKKKPKKKKKKQNAKKKKKNKKKKRKAKKSLIMPL